MGFGVNTLEKYRYLVPDEFQGDTTFVGGQVAGRFWLQRIDVPRRLTVSGIIITGLSPTSNCRGCIYADNGDTPVGGKLTIDTGDIALPAAFPAVIPINPSISLAPGKYWVGIELKSALVTLLANNNGPLSRYFIGPIQGCLYDVPGGYGTPVDPCPTVTNAPSTYLEISLQVASVP